MKEVAIIGGGAAGLAAAVSAAQLGARVTVLEASDRVGAKILATGNGRCNLTNMGAAPGDYNCPAFVGSILERYTPERVRSFFRQLGLLTVEEREGRVYPLSNTANSVLDVLRAACDRLGVQIACGFEADVIVKDGERFYIAGKQGGRCTADAVVVASGGGTRTLVQLGHELASFQPVLCPLSTETDAIRGLSGVRAQVEVSAYDSLSSTAPFASEAGEVLFRDYGISGIVIFNMSRLVGEGQVLSLDFMPGMNRTELYALLMQRREQLGQDVRGQACPISYADLMCGVFHPRINTALLRAARIKPSLPAQADGLNAIAAAVKDFRLTCKGPGDAKHAQVTRGGAYVDEFDPATLESKKVAGVYAAGEVLNVDGRCGGYNLHWAWSSGIVAGRGAAR